MASESRPAIVASIGANLAIAITKLVVGAIARSTAMLAEGVHSLVNCFDGALLLFGQHRAKRPADDGHQFGYARELYFWSLIVAVVFFALGAGVTIYEGASHVRHPEPLGDPKWSYVVLAASALFDGTSFVIGFRQFRRHARGRSSWRTVRQSKNPALFSVVLEDTADLIGLTFAFFGIFFGRRLGLPALDGVASIAIGLVIGVVAIVLLVETHGLLIGESARPGLIEEIRAAALAEPGIRAVASASSLHIGPEEIVVALRLVFDSELTASEVARRTARIDERVRRDHPDVLRVFLEVSAGECAGGQPPGARGTV